MTTILVLNSSIQGESSVSRKMVDTAIAALEGGDDVQIVQRDLVGDAMPHLSPLAMTAVRQGKTQTEAHRAAIELSKELMDELRAADLVVIGSPMYNFGISSQLKSWFDHVLHPGMTFRFTNAGPVGLLENKRALVLEARGGFYSEGPGTALDFQEPFLRYLLSFMGIGDVTFIRAERIGSGGDVAKEALAAAKTSIAAFAKQWRSAA